MSCKKIEINNLTVELAGARARRLVDNVSLTLDGGGSLAIVGESGAGKSMTSLAIMDLLPAGIHRTGGSVIVNHREVAALPPEEKRRFRNRDAAVIMQNPMSAFDPVFTVASHFRETFSSHRTGGGRREWDRLAEKALADVGFDSPRDILGLYPFQMSGGMLQRVMIALALVLDPDFLIADEATTDLDAASQAAILRLIDSRRRQRHLGLLIITHDLGVAAFMAKNVAVMLKGRIVEQGPLREIFAKPTHPYTRLLLAAHRNLYGERFRRLAGSLDAGGSPEDSVSCA